MPFDGVGEKETPGGIRSWTASYTLTASDYRPVFSVEESRKGGFDLHISVEDKRKPEPQTVPLCEVGQAKAGAADRTPMRSAGFAGIRP